MGWFSSSRRATPSCCVVVPHLHVQGIVVAICASTQRSVHFISLEGESFGAPCPAGNICGNKYFSRQTTTSPPFCWRLSTSNPSRSLSLPDRGKDHPRLQPRALVHVPERAHQASCPLECCPGRASLRRKFRPALGSCREQSRAKPPPQSHPPRALPRLHQPGGGRPEIYLFRTTGDARGNKVRFRLPRELSRVRNRQHFATDAPSIRRASREVSTKPQEEHQ